MDVDQAPKDREVKSKWLSITQRYRTLRIWASCWNLCPSTKFSFPDFVSCLLPLPLPHPLPLCSCHIIFFFAPSFMVWKISDKTLNATQFLHSLTCNLDGASNLPCKIYTFKDLNSLRKIAVRPAFCFSFIRKDFPVFFPLLISLVQSFWEVLTAGIISSLMPSATLVVMQAFTWV